MRLRAALIDMDGTLYDSMPRHSAAWHRLCAELGIPVEPDEFYLCEGCTGKAILQKLFMRTFGHSCSAEEADELYHRKTLYFRELGEPSVMPGAQRMVETLRRAGIATVLVTGSGQSSLINCLHRDFPGAFPEHLRVTARNVSHGKPHPEPYLKAMEMAGVASGESIVVENAPSGVTAGHASGALTVGVATGPIPLSVLAEAGADLTYPSMPAFADALPSIISTRQ